MRSRRMDPADDIEKVLTNLGIEEFARVSRLGRMIRVEISYDPLHQERESLLNFKSRLKRLRSRGDTVGKHLIQQIEYFIERLDRVTLEKVLVTIASSDGIEKLEKQLISIQKEMKEKQRKAREMKRLVRSLSSYIREYLRNAGEDSF
ncbi:MAG TPA: hypothetical protein ENF57_01845 [Candidatus Korarchaeota archaeon]|nr:hypothetical protein [Candidatus Korarchaeota archaeon]